MTSMDMVHLAGAELIPDIVYRQQDKIRELHHEICSLNEEIAELNEIIYDLKEELATHKGYHTDDNGYSPSLKTYNGISYPSYVDINKVKEIDALYENMTTHSLTLSEKGVMSVEKDSLMKYLEKSF